MNGPVLTRAAEGLDRWGWTNAQLQRVVEAGIMDADAPVELIRGEIVPRPVETDAHLKMRTSLWRRITVTLELDPAPGPKLIVGSGASLFLFEDTEFRPDVAIFPEDLPSENVRGPDVLIAMEIAKSSHRRDRVIKPPLYAESGLRELWVVDLDKKQTIVHRAPKNGLYSEIQPFEFSAKLTPLALPGLVLRVADFL